jgi:dolichyl-diphosphooligosaccharide--protein glycosyltransferase/undecaprenyl-diphosphooligosaccharide--protein glycosyltransferase
MYASPALALGFAYIITTIGRSITGLRWIQTAIVASSSLIVILMMIHNIQKLNQELKPYYFYKQEVETLKEFSKNITSRDLILSWWDYSWPVWYYTGKKNTLVDNGLHGSDTYLVAKQLLSSSPPFISNSAKYATNVRNAGHQEVLPQIITHSGLSEIFSEFSNQSRSIEASGTPYFLLHRNMLTILPTIAQVANRDPQDGEIKKRAMFLMLDLKKPFLGNSPFVHGKDFTIDLRNGIIYGPNGREKKLGALALSHNGKQKAAKVYSKKDFYAIIYNKNKIFFMDGEIFNSFLIQALLLDNYKRETLKKVYETRKMKIFKVR